MFIAFCPQNDLFTTVGKSSIINRKFFERGIPNVIIIFYITNRIIKWRDTLV